MNHHDRLLLHIDTGARQSGYCTIRHAGLFRMQLEAMSSGDWGLLCFNALCPPLSERDRKRLIDRITWRQVIGAGLFPSSIPDDLIAEIAGDLSEAIDQMREHDRGGSWDQWLRMWERAVRAEITERAKGRAA
jgi:hypothetical protein